MILVLNIGNSNIRFGLFEEDDLLECQKSWVFKSKPSKSKEEYTSLFKEYYKANSIDFFSIKQIVIGSVVPFLTPILFEVLEKIHKVTPHLVDRNSPSAIKHSSSELGCDLYANLVFAYHTNKHVSTLVIDLGTALTFSLVNKEAQFDGVIIAPGIETSLFALIKNTAQLKEIPLESPSRLMGKDTKTCMQSGIIYGFVSMIEGLIEKIKKENICKEDLRIIITGGLSLLYGPLIKEAHKIDQLHTLKGLRLLYHYSTNY